MLRFRAFENRAPIRTLNLEGAHMIGNDHVPVRAEFKIVDGELVCNPKSRGAAALALMWPVEGAGVLMMETARLMERAEPYNLHVELARGQLMRICQKREDWGLYDFPDGAALYKEIDAARGRLVDALAASDEATIASLAEESLRMSVKVGEALGLFHADVFFKRRLESDPIAARALGCRLELGECTATSLPLLSEGFEFASLQIPWATLQPEENSYRMAPLEQGLQLLRQRKIPVWGGNLLSFAPHELPQWVRQTKGYDRIRDHIGRHLRKILKALEGHLQAWEVASGLHAQNPLQLNFEQIMELTRAATAIARQVSPRCPLILGICCPWGEYYATDAHTIPPLLYAEMATQSGISFDAFGIHLPFGGQLCAQYMRDMMQISSMLDRFGSFGKPLHITAAGVPSAGATPASGYWHRDWSEDVQAEWLRDFYQIAFSKPFVETVSWQALIDGMGTSPSGGLIRTDQSRKPAFDELVRLRRSLHSRREG